MNAKQELQDFMIMVENMQLVVIEQIKETKDMALLDLVSQLLLFESR